MNATLQKRVVDVKRHTKGYIISGKRVPRGQAVKMARRGQLYGVTARKRGDGWCIASKPSTKVRLYDLPEIVEK